MILSSSLLLFLNLKSLYLALCCILLIFTYPLMKRFLPIPQLYLGICYSMGIFMAYAFYQGAFPLNCWLLFLGNIFWVLAYDTVYALSDRQDDLLINVKSSAIYFQGKEIDLIWDKTGDHYNLGKGLMLFIDQKLVTQKEKVQKIFLKI